MRSSIGPGGALLLLLLLGCGVHSAPVVDTAPPATGPGTDAAPPLATVAEAVTPSQGDGASPPGPTTVPATTSSEVAAYLQDSQALATGAQLFRGVCTGYCHTSRVGVEREAPDLFDCAWTHGDEDADVFRVIAEGVPDTRMQGFQGKLPDSELWKIVAFLRVESRCGDD